MYSGSKTALYVLEEAVIEVVAQAIGKVFVPIQPDTKQEEIICDIGGSSLTVTAASVLLTANLAVESFERASAAVTMFSKAASSIQQLQQLLTNAGITGESRPFSMDLASKTAALCW